MSGNSKAPVGRSPEAETARRESRAAARRAVFTVRYACTIAIPDDLFSELDRFDPTGLGPLVDVTIVSSGQRVVDRATHDHVLTVLESDAAVVSWRDRVVS